MDRKLGNERVDELVQLLREAPHTARGIAAKLGISKPTAYARVAKLAMSGVAVVRSRVREGLHGPEADAFFVVVSAVPRNVAKKAA